MITAGLIIIAALAASVGIGRAWWRAFIRLAPEFGLEPAMSKADYVRAQGQTRSHHCHWTGCTRQVPPAMWGCRPHWYRLPAHLRRRIWRCYQPGQEVTGRPSADYVEVAREVQAWIAAQPGETPAPDLFGGDAS